MRGSESLIMFSCLWADNNRSLALLLLTCLSCDAKPPGEVGAERGAGRGHRPVGAQKKVVGLPSCAPHFFKGQGQNVQAHFFLVKPFPCRMQCQKKYQRRVCPIFVTEKRAMGPFFLAQKFGTL
jgi:hypothetical protein